MTLDPVHVDGIAALAEQVREHVDEGDSRELAGTVYGEFLDPLSGEDGVVLEPLGDVERYHAPAQDLGLQTDPFGVVHGLDSGTVSPRTFRNGLVVDVAHAAMSATPSDLDLHRARTVVQGVHSNDPTVDPGTDWEPFDDGCCRRRTVDVTPPDHVRDAGRAVHWTALYHAESSHALAHADRVSECLLLDGPLYPKEIVSWGNRAAGYELRDLVAEEDLLAETLGNYVDLVERFVERDVPLAGFVKSGASGALLRALRASDGAPRTPWANDLAFFAAALRGAADDHLAWTNWFVSRLGADGTFAASGDAGGVDRALDPAAYEVAFFAVHDTRTDLTFKVELPRAFAEDAAVREQVRAHVLRGVAGERGPPPAVARADALANIDQQETASLVDRIEDAFRAKRDASYDRVRYGEGDR